MAAPRIAARARNKRPVTRHRRSASDRVPRRRTTIAALALLVLATAPIFALDPNRSLSQFGLDLWQRRQGLPQSSVNAIAQTADGYLWIGTEEGLARFDGVRFTVFDRKNTPEMERHNVTALQPTARAPSGSERSEMGSSGTRAANFAATAPKTA